MITIWINAQISPAVRPWINSTYSHIQARSLRSLELLIATVKGIFFAAKPANAIIMTKDHDFYQLLPKYGIPPPIIWLTCGNTFTNNLCKLLMIALPVAVELINNGQPIVEIH